MRGQIHNAYLTLATVAVVLAGAALADEIDDARSVILKKLKDPESARFSEIVQRDATDFKGNPVNVTCGLVNARNSSGGYEGPKKFFVVGRLGFIYLGRQISIDIMDQFADIKAFQRFCP